MAELHERLKAEVEGRGLIKEFTAAMRATGLRGTSKPTIYSYLLGRTSPSYEWLERAAEYLGISTHYLRTGEGPRTASDALAQQEPIPSATGAPDREPDDAFERVVVPVLRTLSRYVSKLLAGRGLDIIEVFLIAHFVVDLYEHVGPTAFGVDYDGWGPRALLETAPDVLVEEEVVRSYVTKTFAPSKVLKANPWSQKAATLALLASLYLTEFDGVR